MTSTPQPKARKKRKLPKIISPEEAGRLMAYAARGEEGPRNRLMLELMYRAGLRVSEVVALQPGDIERDGVIHLYDAKGGDGTAYFDEGLAVDLDRWLDLRKSWGAVGDKGLLFIRRDGQPITVRYIQRFVKKLKADVGIPDNRKLTPHVLRHTYATELIEEGVPIHEVQRAMRHANLATTEVYLHVRDEALRKKLSHRGREEVKST